MPRCFRLTEKFEFKKIEKCFTSFGTHKVEHFSAQHPKMWTICVRCIPKRGKNVQVGLPKDGKIFRGTYRTYICTGYVSLPIIEINDQNASYEQFIQLASFALKNQRLKISADGPFIANNRNLKLLFHKGTNITLFIS